MQEQSDSMTQHAGAERAVRTMDRQASRRAVSTVPRGAALADRQAVDVWAMGGFRLTPAVYAAAAGGCNALNLLHASVCLKLGLQHILQTFCTRPACQLPNDSARNYSMSAANEAQAPLNTTNGL